MNSKVNWRKFLPRNQHLKQLLKSIAADNQFPMPDKVAAEIFLLINRWNDICGMNPGNSRENLRSKIKGIVESALAVNDLACLKDHSDYRDLIRLADFALTPVRCSDCGQPVHICWHPYSGSFDPGGYHSIYPVNESLHELLLVNWKEKDISQLPSGYHLNNCPLCGKIGMVDFDHPETMPKPGNCFRFLQEFTMILPEGERFTFADASALTLNDFAHSLSKEDLKNKIFHFKNLPGIAIRDEMESLTDGEILALANYPKAPALVLESAFIVFKHREHWAEKLMFAYRNGLLTVRDAKMYMLHYVNVRGNQYPTDLAFYMELLNDKSKDVVGNALVAVTFFNNPAVIPQLVEMRDTRWKSVPKKSNQRFSMVDYFSLSMAALKCGNPYIAYPFLKDCDNRWGFLAQWEKWSQLDRRQKDAIIAQALADAETEEKQ